MQNWGGLTIAAAFFVSTSALSAASLPSSLIVVPATDTKASHAVVPVVVFGHDARREADAFAAEHDINDAELTRNHLASGLIHCGNAHGAGQLTLSDDVVTTAAHVFYDENGMPRARTCSFDISVNGRETHVPIDLTSIVAGSTKPYDAAVSHDWAVARLSRALTGVRPYGLASEIHDNEPVTFVSRGHIDWGEAKNLSFQQCTLHDKLSDGEEGTREFSFDCDTGDGASGGALMFDKDMTRVGAILVGWRSNRPFKAMPFSRTHYNFAVTIEGAFRQAIYAASGKLVSQK